MPRVLRNSSVTSNLAANARRFWVPRNLCVRLFRESVFTSGHLSRCARKFVLVGGRLDFLGGHNVVALVYSRRKHIINVFILPTKEPDTSIHPPGLRQGYQWRHWRRQGMEYCAISDVSDSDLYELAQLMYQ